VTSGCWQTARLGSVCRIIMGMSLAPRTAEWLAMLHRIDAPRLHELPVAAARHSYDKLMYAYAGPKEAVASVAELRLERREHEGGALTVRLYRPAGSGDEALPVLLWLHGGGWVLGSLDNYDHWCRALANACGAAVCALDYRLAPEHRFPAAVDDTWFALRWLAREASSLGLDGGAISIAGDSAGGTLAAATSLLARDAGGPTLQRQILIYPAVDLLGDYPSAQRYGVGHFLEQDALHWFAHQYLETLADREDWRASPLLADNHAGLPPTLIINAECDPLADQGMAYARVLEACGVPVRHVVHVGMTHGYVTMFKLFDEARAALGEIARALQAPLV